MAARFYAHLVLEDEGMDLLFCHRWLLLGFKREFHDLHLLRMWEACWSHYQTEYFHIFICVAIVIEYGDLVWQKSMRVDEMLNYFNNLAFEMDGERVLRQARSLLYQFRKLAGIPCTLRGLLSGPGAWDSATLPEIECTCHETRTCKYSNPPRRGESLSRENAEMSEKQENDERGLTVSTSQGTGNKPASDGVKSEPERELNSTEQESNDLNCKERQENESSNLRDHIPNEEQKLDSSDTKEQENGVTSDDFDSKERQEKGCTNLKDEIQRQNETKVDISDLNQQNNDDSIPEEHQTNGLKEKIPDGHLRVDACDLMNGDLSSEIQQNMNESTKLKDEIPIEEQRVDNSNLNEGKQGLKLSPKEQQTNDKTSSSEAKCEQ